MKQKFKINLADGIKFEDFIHNSGLIYDLFPQIIGYCDTRNHSMEGYKGPRFYCVNGNDYELPDFELHTSNGIIWLEAKVKKSGSFPYTLWNKQGHYFSFDRPKFNSYQLIADETNSDLYFIFGDLVENKIYLYREYDFDNFGWLKMGKGNEYCPLYPATDKFLVAKIEDYDNNKYCLIN